MKILVDNRIASLLAHDPAKILKSPLLSDKQFRFTWPSLFAYLGLDSLFSSFPPFDPTQPVFIATVSTLYAVEERDVICHVFDRLFTECLNQVRALPQINAPFLLQAIKERSSTLLAAHETAFRENPAHTMHDLILYLAWDRMCVWMRQLFNYQSKDPKFLKALAVLRECLIESYLHIAKQGRTRPGLFRLIESLFFYEMREENLQKHKADEWTLLSQSFPALKPESEMIDFSYIDEEESFHLTLDAPALVNQRLALAKYMMDRLHEEVTQWTQVINPQNIIHFTI